MVKYIVGGIAPLHSLVWRVCLMGSIPISASKICSCICVQMREESQMVLGSSLYHLLKNKLANFLAASIVKDNPPPILYSHFLSFGGFDIT